MPTDQRAELATIRRFDQLVAYLRDEMGWPIDRDDFEELTFEYTPEELGIDAKNAAKVEEIKRLRPLSTARKGGRSKNRASADASAKEGSSGPRDSPARSKPVNPLIEKLLN